MVTNFRAMFVSLGEFLDPFAERTFSIVTTFCAPMTDSSIADSFPPEDTLALTIRTPGKLYSLSPRALEGREKGLHPPRGVACQNARTKSRLC